jgi:glycosyltransferase involved in cell wall biosynthesis
MKIIIIVRILWTAGAPKKAIREAKELSKLGHNVKLIFLRKATTLSGYEDLLEGINFRIITEHNHSPLVPIYDYLTGKFAPDRKGEGRLDYNLIRKLPHFVRNEYPDFVICHDQYSGLGGYYIKKKLGVRYSVLLHERVDSKSNGILHRLANHYERRTLINASCIIASSHKIAISLFQKYNMDCSVNYQGLDLSNFKRYESKEDALVAVSMWDIGRKPMIYLDIIKKLPNFKLFLIGNWRDKTLRNTFVEEISRRNLVGRVVLASGIDENKLNDFYDRSKFVIRFGFGEYGESHAVFEGLQRGLPVIINRDLGSSELIDKYKVGIVTDDLTPENIAAKIQKLDTEETYVRIQENILKAAKDLMWSTHARNLICLQQGE